VLPLFFQDLFHVKAPEVGRIRSISLRLDHKGKDHRLTLHSLYIIHNAVTYNVDLAEVTLDKEQPQKRCYPKEIPLTQSDKITYHIATHTTDKSLSSSSVLMRVIVTGTEGTFGNFVTLYRSLVASIGAGPIELKQSLTSGNHPFERECIDLFAINEINIGNPTSLTMTVEPRGTT
jgi:hypothetical protein